jgi:hypothetical protein
VYLVKEMEKPKLDPREYLTVSLQVVHRTVQKWIFLEHRINCDAAIGREPRRYAGATNSKLQLSIQKMYDSDWARFHRRRWARKQDRERMARERKAKAQSHQPRLIIPHRNRK